MDDPKAPQTKTTGTVLPAQCNPRLFVMEDSSGCSVTRATVKAMTPSDFEANYWKEVGMENIVAREKELRLVGVEQKGLSDLLMSRMAPIKQINLGQSQSQSVISPYVLLPQESVVNANYFTVVTGNPVTGGVTGTSLPASAWELTVTSAGNTAAGSQGSSDPDRPSGAPSTDYSTDLEDVERYFLPGRWITVLWADAADHSTKKCQLRIIHSEKKTGVGAEGQATLIVHPNVDDGSWANPATALWSGVPGAGLAAKQANFHPTKGMVLPLSNSVSDYESWCHQDPAENTWALKAFWLQTIRETHIYNQEYIEALSAPLTSEFFKKFRTVPLAKQKRRQQALARNAYFNTVFFGDKISDLQTPAQYDQLEKVYDPLNPSCLLEYKANTIGIDPQLSECGRSVDMSGANLDIDSLKYAMYDLRRRRSANGSSIDRIDAFTDRFTAGNILTLMCNYYQSKYGYSTERFFSVGETIKHEDITLWNYDKYQFREEGVELCVIHDTFFDDYLAATPSTGAGTKDAYSNGRWFMMIDWSDIMLGLSQSHSVMRKTNEADNIYNCVIKPNITNYQLSSKTVSMVVQDPKRHLIYKNFGDDCPKLTSTSCAITVGT